MTERDKVTVNDIIGLVDCEPTNSVEEVKKLRGRENKTEKRFILVEYVNKGLFIQDNANDETQYFQGSKASLEKVVDLLNSLNGENEQLKLISNHRGEMVSFATSLIQDMGSEEMLKMWNDFKEVMYQKWKKKRGIK